MPRKPKETKAPIEIPTKSGQVPVNQKMLALVRSEFHSRNKALELSLDSRFKTIDSRFKTIDSRFNEMDARFNQVDSRFDEMDARFSKLESMIHGLASEVTRVVVLVEEQRSENRIVLEGYGLLYKKTSDLDLRVKRLESRK